MQRASAEQAAFEELNARIVLLNDRYASEFSPATRGLFGRWFLRIFASDAIGAALGSPLGGIGAIIGGIWGSLGAASVAIAETDDTEDYLASDENLFEEAMEEAEITGLSDDDMDIDSAEKDYAVIYEGFDKVGYIHNDVIRAVYADEDIELKDLERDEILQLILSKVSECYDVEVSADVLAHVEANAAVMSDSFYDFANEDPYAVLTSAMPGYADEFSIIRDYCETIAGLCHDKTLVRAYLEDFLKVVTDSKVNETSKHMLKAAACVGSNSSLLWQLREVEAVDPGEEEEGEY